MSSSWLSTPQTGGTLRRWLVGGGSLSYRIQQRCANFRVVRLRQALCRAYPDETQPLGLVYGKVALVREVILFCGETPVIFAHSVALREDLNGAWRGLRGLGSRPLASALFDDPRIEHLPLAFRKLNARHPLYRRARQALSALMDELPPALSLWARRRVFLREGAPLLVTEVFLPGILRLPS